MDKSKLNPPATAMCQEYMSIYIIAIQTRGKKGVEYFKRLKQHRATCPLCWVRMNDENAVEPEVKE